MSKPMDVNTLLSGREPEKSEGYEVYSFESYELGDTSIHEIGWELDADVTGELQGLDDEDTTYFISFTY